MGLDKVEVSNLIADIIDSGTEVDISERASPGTIDLLENEIGIKLPDDLREFLLEYGAIHICGSYIGGIFNNNLSEHSEGTIKFEVDRFRADSRIEDDPSFIVLSCEGLEWYMGVNADDDKVYGFDALAGEYVEQYPSFSSYLVEFLRSLA